MIKIICPFMKVPTWLQKVESKDPYRFTFSCFGVIYVRHSMYIVRGLVGNHVMYFRPVKGGSVDGYEIKGQSPDSLGKGVFVYYPPLRWVDIGLYAGLTYLIYLSL